MRYLASILVLLVLVDPAAAQFAHHPFAVGANEGAVGHQTGLGAWLIGQESRFYTGLTRAVHEVRGSPQGLLFLLGLSFAYGVFHAAGPGHGKAVIASYMVSNEVALRRGLLIALAAALLQGLVATTLVTIAAFVFNATALRMTAAAQAIEIAGYVGIVGLGLMLVWRKGWALMLALRPLPVVATSRLALASVAVSPPMALRLGPRPSPSRFFADSGDDACRSADESCDCGRMHMPDPALFGGQRFDRKAAALAIVTAGARPCSGAILVLVFTLSQGLYLAGVASTFAMALGTALTTAGLATLAVFAKDAAMRIAGGRAGNAMLIGRMVECAAALCVLAVGLALLVASLSGVASGA